MRVKSGIMSPEMRFLYLSPAGRQAILGLRGLALLGGAGLVSEAAARAKVPAASLAKVFQRLARRGLLESRRGPGGGYRLRRPASNVPLSDVLRAVQDIIPGGSHCLLGNRLCGTGGRFCPVHRVIIQADLLVIEGLSRITLEDLARSEGWT